jgi:hypothetical protein
MRRVLLICLVCLLLLGSGTLRPLPAADTSPAAVEARLEQAARLLASDEFEGRGVGTAGLDKAADYLAAEFARIGLKTDLFEGTPFQKFSVTVKTELGPRDQNRLELVGPPAAGAQEPTRLTLALEEAFTPLATGGAGSVDAPLVFVGYGITDKEQQFDEYAGIDVKDKVVLLIRKEPQQGDPHSAFNGVHPSQHATFMRKLANAYEHGAKGVILVNDQFDLEQQRDADQKAWRKELDTLVETRNKLVAEGTEPAAAAKLTTEINRLAESISTRAKRLTTGYDELLPFAGAGNESSHKTMPVWFMLRSSADAVVQQATGKSLAQLEAEIDETLKPRSQPLAGWIVRGEAAIVQQQAEVKNVIGVLPGQGPLANEIVVVGAHYDHVGYGGPGSLAPWTHEVHNGADDNASGTVALVEVAKRLAESSERPRRTIVFMAFTGEERGLLGSAYYCRNPRFSLEKTVAMINMDMVGRLTNDKLIVYGTGTAAEFEGLVDEVGTKQGFTITKHPGGFGPSDHASFYAQKIPVLHLFTGNHDDYHRPSDDAEKLNVPGMRRVVDFVVDTVQKIDAAEARPAYREIKTIEHIGDVAGDRPYFGSIPDYASEEVEGLKLTGVVEGGPAAKGGLQGGDVIVGLGESRIGGIEDFDSALRKFKAGDRAKVTVRRGEETVELEVVLGKRPRSMP